MLLSIWVITTLGRWLVSWPIKDATKIDLILTHFNRFIRLIVIIMPACMDFVVSPDKKQVIYN